MAHSTAAPASPHGQDQDNASLSGSDARKFVDVQGKRVILLLIAFILLLWGGSKYHAAQEKGEQAQQMVAQQQAAQAAEAVRQTRVCGTIGNPVCDCKGENIPMRYLKPHTEATYNGIGDVTFFPHPSPNTFRICKRDKSLCNDGTPRKERFFLNDERGVIDNTSDRVQVITCERVN